VNYWIIYACRALAKGDSDVRESDHDN
jgi:hypothetical protein